MSLKEQNIQNKLSLYQSEIQEELKNILNWWMTFSVDKTNGGFYGKINNDNTLFPEAEKGLVLNARILWTFSAACNFLKNLQYLDIAKRAYSYINAHFYDKKNGGLYWSVDAKGIPQNKRKQIYGIAFVIYGLTEYYLATNESNALGLSQSLFYLIEKHSFDKDKNGYLEAFTEDWNLIDDMRLSAKDKNEKKTMNTHLHILEAYTNLCRVWDNNNLKKQLTNLVHIFLEKMIDKNTHHLNLFFDETWEVRGSVISYGHDIEATWLLNEAAEATEDKLLIEEVKIATLKMAEATIEGLDKDGGLKNEKSGRIEDNEKHWWPQAEAMVGFLNTYQLSGNKKYLTHALHTWDFIKLNIINKPFGEWYWGINPDYSIMENEEKAGFWKCPYHNSRACIEIIKRMDIINPGLILS